MWRLTLVLLSLGSFSLGSPIHRPVKRDSQTYHIVQVPSHQEPQSLLEKSDNHGHQSHLDKSENHFGHQSHLGESSHTHQSDASSQSRLKQHSLSQTDKSQNDHLGYSQRHHFEQMQGRDFDLSFLQENQPSQNRHLDQPTSQVHPHQSSKSVHDQNEVHPQSKSERKSRKGPKKGRKSNEDLLHHVGLTKLRPPAVNHHRKRLASQSRKSHGQKSSSDSKMFVIKLPPNPYYYAHHDLQGYEVEKPQPNSVNKVPVNFNTNGKPSRVYHWNIPVLKKMVARKAGSAGKSAILADSDIFNIDKQATWNETDDEKSYRKAVFYGPKKQSKHTFRKYFAGNGKPHSFYVMDKKNKSPSNIYRLLP